MIKKIESEIINSYEKGTLAKEITKRYRIGNTTLFRILKRNRVSTKNALNQYKNKDGSDRYCKNCNKAIVKKLGESWKQFSQKIFCSRKCFGKNNEGLKTGRVPKSAFKKGHAPWNKGISHLVGEKNPNWKPKISLKCGTCGKSIKLHPYRTVGVTKNYCSRRCTILSQEQPQFNTGPERIFKKLLIELGLKENGNFIHQYIFENKFKCDFAFPKEKIIFEIQGDYYHVNPEKYPYNPETFIMANGNKLHLQKQIKNLKRDKSKFAYIKRCGWRVYPIWELNLYKNRKNVTEMLKFILGINK